jgi:gliding motility-associated lipoprotein GldH
METGTGPVKSLLAIVIAVVLTSCGQDIIYSGHENMPPEGWNRYNTATFNAEITDTITPASIDISIRTGSAYPYRNIFLFVSTFAPNGIRIVDTLEYTLSDSRGNRMGRGTGDIRELDLSLRKNVYFPHAGPYLIRVEHAMRTETLEGVYDVGLIIRRETGKKR